MLAAVCVTAVAHAGPARAAASTDTPASPPRVPVLRWRPCDHAYQCATARVPLDYRQPGGRQISLAVIRHPATDRAHRIGSLFFNPGGPGGPGTVVLPIVYSLLPANVRARFDVVTFDPRGIPRSSAVRCFPSAAAENRFLAAAPAGFPAGPRQQAQWMRVYAAFDAACARHDDGLLAHVSTADVARDMDLLRQAVHDPALNYLGVSYGTLLGATYANLFPQRVGHMVLDGNVDPVAWAQPDGVLPTMLREHADQALAAAMRSFLRRCGSAPASLCAFSAGAPGATQRKFTTLLSRLRRHPVAAGTPRQTYTYASAIATLADDLQTAQSSPVTGPGWPGAAALLQQLWTASAAPGGPAGAPRVAVASADPYNGLEQQQGVTCAESPNPRDPDAYAAAARLAYQRSGAVGQYWMWWTRACFAWPVIDADRYAGPWNRDTAHPVLVIGNTGDPATAYRNSVSMSRDLARARLLTVDGYGHTELLNHSACANRYESRYLVAGALPRPGTVCQEDFGPFGAG